MCFTCVASDGRSVTLFRDVYHGHIIGHRKPEIARDYEFPSAEIERALTQADGAPVPSASNNQRRIYRGPRVKPREPKLGMERWRVVVETHKDGDWIVTAYPVID